MVSPVIIYFTSWLTYSFTGHNLHSSYVAYDLLLSCALEMNARNVPFQAIPAGSSEPIGVIVCKQSMHKHTSNRGYIAMLSVNKSWRKRGVGAL